MSGDSIIIRGPPKGGPPPEKQVNLAFVTAPKVSRRIPPNELNPKGSMTTEEPYAWEAREFLRKKLVGNEVSIKIEYKVPFGQTNRDCGLVYLSNGESVVESIVLEGLVDVIKRKQNTDNVEYQKLIAAEESAIAAGKGKHSSEPYARREALQDVEDPSSLIGKSLEAVVEHVMSGSTMRLQLNLGQNKWQMVTVMLSGIKCPSLGEPYGEEGKFFTESRLLQKDVTVRIESVSSGGKNPSQSVSFMGSVCRLGNNIAEHLLKEGFAKCMDWTLSSALNPEKLRAAETEAKNKKLRLFKDYNKVKTSSETWIGKVTEIINADALMIQNVETNEFKKIFLASVRAPPRPENVTVTRVLYDVPFMFEAREFLRTRLIGKKVKVHVDYVQPKSDQYQEKTCATVTTLDGGVNIAEALIAKGLAKVVRYRPDDESRSSCYDALLDAEVKAQAAKKGLHGNTEKGIVRIVDLSNDATKAKQFLPFLQRGSGDSRREGIVEFVYSGSRIKVFIPKENCALNLILSGISTPKVNEPFSVETINFVKSLIYQRPISITVDAMDKVGNFIGSVYFDNKNLIVELLRNGYASIRDERGSEFKSAEDEAKAKKLNIWANYKEEEVVEDNNNEEPEEEEETNGDATNGDSSKTDSPTKTKVEKKEDRKSIIITQVSPDAATFYAQFVDQGPALEELITELRDELDSNPPLPGAYTASKGDVCAAKYSADGLWYRARVDKPLPNKQFQVTFVDYGNQEVVKSLDLAPFPDNKFNTASLPAAAKLFSIAFVQMPTDEADLIEAREAFLDETMDKVLLMRSEYKDASGLEHVTLYDKENKDRDIGLALVETGYFLVNLKERRRERRLQKSITDYRAAQDSAKKKRVCFAL